MPIQLNKKEALMVAKMLDDSDEFWLNDLSPQQADYFRGRLTELTAALDVLSNAGKPEDAEDTPPEFCPTPFPVLGWKHIEGCPQFVDMAKLDSGWAQVIHGQSLSRIKDRGGMSPAEIYGNINRCPFFETNRIPLEVALATVRAIACAG